MTRHFAVALLVALLVGESHAATLYVNSARVQDAQDGSEARRFRTITEALKNISPGDHLLIAPGVYRESLDLTKTRLNGGQPSRPTIIEGAAGGEVIIKGSNVVADWEALDGGVFVRRDWKVNSQQVFVDGVSLQQIGGTIYGGYPERADHDMHRFRQLRGGIWPGRVAGGLKEMTVNSFFYDQSAEALYIKLAPGERSVRDKIIEVSVRNMLARGEGLENLEIRNLTFSHSNGTSVGRSAAVTFFGRHVIADNVKVTWTDGGGLAIRGEDHIVRNSAANYCGQLGMAAWGRNIRFINNETSYNNQRGFNQYWEAGGAKFIGGETGMRDSFVIGHRAFFNLGDGIWFDTKNPNNQIRDSQSAYNKGYGIHYEASIGAHIENNYVYGNGHRGIYLPNSSNSVIAHNLVLNNLEGIIIVNDRVEQAKEKPWLLPTNNHVYGNVVAWNKKTALMLPKDLLGNTSKDNLFISETPPKFSLGWENYANAGASSLDDWNKLSGQDQNSWQKLLPIPDQLSAKLEKKQTNLDWSQVTTIVSKLQVSNASQLPGPRK